MPTKFDDAFARVQKLVAIFESGKDRYLSSDYQEAEVRKDFIDKFFTALGWDVNHDEQTNPYAQEVKVERGVNEGSSRKRADYAFHLAPNFRDVRFYVEAKRPSKDFASSDNCHQAIRYGWFTKRTSPFAVLTSFEDFFILDCRLKPNINDTLSRIVERFSYTDYADSEKFARIYWLFSREAVADGSLEKFADNRPVARGKRYQRGLFKGSDTQPDEDFLVELDSYRQQLAQAFKRANPDLDGDTLTEVTQRTLDRLVFTRFLEDKGIESPIIENFGKADGIWEDFIAASLRLDRKYNGVVFKFHPRLDAPGFKPDEKVFARICEELTDPTSPYNFNVIPIHILGSIYERFLGKVISDGAKVVEKPEVRKAGGVYYTPEYIVRYIVENTVGRMIAGKTPEEIAKLKFADIACGSGSFLLGVYDVLLKYHAEYYSKNPGKVRKGDCVRRDGTLHLSLQKKRDILTNNLFGVDIDRQAVEVAQLSLYLKLLEDETVGTTSEYQDEFHFTLLPSLDKNIVCGNSLIGPDIADGGKLTDEEEKKINPLDYAQRFPTIFRRRRGDEAQTLREQSETPHVVSYKGGFGELRETAPGEVMPHNVPDGSPLHGNYPKSKKTKAAPPRLPEYEYEGGFDAIVGNPPYGADFDKYSETYIRDRFRAVSNSLDSFIMFVEQAGNLLNSKGQFGMIIPSGWVSTPSSKKLRERFAEQFYPTSFVSLPYDVFDGAYIDTIIVTAQRLASGKRWTDLEGTNVDLVVFPIRQKVEGQKDFDRFRMVGDYADWIKSTDKEFLVLSSREQAALVKKLRASPAKLNSIVEVMRGIETYNPRSATDCQKPKRAFNGEMLRYELDLGPEAYEGFPPSIEAGKPVKFFKGQRILLRQLLSRKFRLQAVFAEQEFLTNQSIQSLIPRSSIPHIKCVLAILNSRLLSWYFCQINMVARRDDFPKTIIKQTRELPFPKIDLANKADKSRHDRLVELVEQMLAAKAKLPSAKTDRDREFYTNKCATLDQQIDALVYELYGLTAEEIKLVEGGQ